MGVIEFIRRIFTRLNRKDYFQEPPSSVRMIRIRCIDSKCTAHEDPFLFDERSVGAIGLAKSEDKEAEAFIITCPVCGTRLKIFLLKEKKEEISRGVSSGFSKRPPSDRGPASGWVDFAF